MTVAKRNKRAKPDPELVKLADSLLANYQKPEDLVGENGLLKQLNKMLVERALETEMSEHLGHGKSETVTNATGNTRNGHSAKTLQGEFGELPLDIPRDRQGAFEPKLVERHQTRWSGFDDKIISLYARGLSVREIQGHLEEMYGTEVSPTLISAVTDAVSEEVKLWQARPLDALYPIIYLDCIHVKVRDSGAVRTKAVYLAIGVNMDGHKEALGLWIAQTEGAKFWLQVVTELKTRGVQDIFIACVDGLKGLPESSRAALHRAHGAQLPELRVVESAARSCRRSEDDLHINDSRTGHANARSVRGQVGQGLSVNRAELAAQLGTRRSILRLSAGNPQSDLYDQRH